MWKQVLRVMLLSLFIIPSLVITTVAATTTATAVIAAGAAETIDPNPDLSDLWAQVRQQPDDFSLGCVSLISPAGGVFYNADTPFPLASVSKLLILLEYARRVSDGRISMDEQVSLDALNLYNLPRTNGGEHERFLQEYPEETRSISLWDVAVIGMIQYSSNAAADYLLNYLQPVDWAALYRELDLTATDYPHPLTAIALLMENHETGQPKLSEISSLSMTDGETLLKKYVQDPQWRESELTYREGRRRVFPSWEVQQAVLDQLTVKGTVHDFIKILTTVYGENSANPLSSSARRMVRNAMQWRTNDLINNTYVEYGSKLGFYSGGTLTLVAFGDPYSGPAIVSAVFFRDLPRDVYSRLMREDSIGSLAHWMNLNSCTGLNDKLPQ